jgi:hypothetical protein
MRAYLNKLVNDFQRDQLVICLVHWKQCDVSVVVVAAAGAQSKQEERLRWNRSQRMHRTRISHEQT